VKTTLLAIDMYSKEIMEIIIIGKKTLADAYGTPARSRLQKIVNFNNFNVQRLVQWLSHHLAFSHLNINYNQTINNAGSQ
jgi:hypothetical protein